jgi:hypothetical protein
MGRAKMIKTLTAASLALGLGFASAAFANPNNDSFIAQIGAENGAIVYQTHGNNHQGTLQVGAFNNALTFQTNTKGDKSNNSLTAQFGFDNSALTIQTAAKSYENNSAVIQAGAGNRAFVMQH